MLAIYKKSLPIGLDRVLSINLTINLKSLIALLILSDRIYLCLTTKIGHH